MIDLYSAATPNGYKISIALEEMALPFTLHTIDFSNAEQKSPAFLKINPNGKIPAIIDRDAGDFALFESGAILIYLAEKTGRFLPTDAKGRALTLQWLMLQMSGIGPMMGQAFVFQHYFPEKIQSVIDRYQHESARLMKVLDTRLQEAEYLAGDYSIADMATWPWVVRHPLIGLDTAELPHLQRWLDQVAARPAVQRGDNNPPRLSDEERIERARSMLVK